MSFFPFLLENNQNLYRPVTVSEKVRFLQLILNVNFL